MNYRHAYHAGNFADVLKHVVLVALIEALCKKDTPLAYVDTHAGAGVYDLAGDAPARTREAADGIERLRNSTLRSQGIHTYLQVVAACARQLDTASLYPGSPWIAAHLLRAQDQLILCEWQEAEWAQLKRVFAGDPRVAVHRRDGYAALGALLPPRARRGLVLIDPPYEQQEREFDAIDAALRDACKRFPQAVYAVWYPIKRRTRLAPFYRHLRARSDRPVLVAEMEMHPLRSELRLNGCGMALLHPPWKLETRLCSDLPVLAEAMGATGDLPWRVDFL